MTKFLFGALCLMGVVSFSTVAGRTITVTNQCSYTVWPAVFTDLNVGTAVPDVETGWEAPPGTTRSFAAPDNWTAGRIWGRRDCDFSTNPGPTSCSTGGCNGGLLCDIRTGTGVPPVTLAEFTLSASGGLDFYDVSLVDGSNIPMRITTSASCPVAECAVDLNINCPAALKLLDSKGITVGCKSDCLVDPNPQNSKACCSGSYSTPETCPNSGVINYSFFKTSCPRSYVYAYDESSGTALFTCDKNLKADYTITFCPDNKRVAANPQPTPGDSCSGLGGVPRGHYFSIRGSHYGLL
ncbi:hypothetical protein FRC02_002281 [Tulasnella sp. 418]|nr:hypothetical protein FRC02_002281 [Tulasnella sp. 418]